MAIYARLMAVVEDLQKTVFFVTRIGGSDSVERVRSDDLMDLVLSPAVANFNAELRVVRADKIAAHGRITDNIIGHLLHSAYVIVDATGKNPNVYYELGVAHAFHRRVVLLIDDPTGLPFDTQGEAHIIIPGDGELSGRAVNEAIPNLVRALEAARDASAPPGPVAAAQAQLTPPDISGSEATTILRTSIRELTDRVESLEGWGNTVEEAARNLRTHATAPNEAMDWLATDDFGKRVVMAITEAGLDAPLESATFTRNHGTLQLRDNQGHRTTVELDRRMHPPAIVKRVGSALSLTESQRQKLLAALTG